VRAARRSGRREHRSAEQHRGADQPGAGPEWHGHDVQLRAGHSHGLGTHLADAAITVPRRRRAGRQITTTRGLSRLTAVRNGSPAPPGRRTMLTALGVARSAQGPRRRARSDTVRWPAARIPRTSRPATCAPSTQSGVACSGTPVVASSPGTCCCMWPMSPAAPCQQKQPVQPPAGYQAGSDPCPP